MLPAGRDGDWRNRPLLSAAAMYKSWRHEVLAPKFGTGWRPQCYRLFSKACR